MKNTILLIMALAFISQSCGSMRRAVSGDVSPKSERILMKRLVENQVNAEWLGARAKVSYSDEYGSEAFSAYIRVKKDSAIWLAFKKFSIEGVRVLITPDSVYIIDRLNGEYSAEPFGAIQQKYQLPLSFQGLQALMLGNPVFFSMESEVATDSNHYILTQKNNHLAASYRIELASFLLREFLMEDFDNRRSLRVTTSNYQPLEDKQNFSYFRTLKLSGPETGVMHVNIEFTKVEINVPQKMEFTIPEQYRQAK